MYLLYFHLRVKKKKKKKSSLVEPQEKLLVMFPFKDLMIAVIYHVLLTTQYQFRDFLFDFCQEVVWQRNPQLQ